MWTVGRGSLITRLLHATGGCLERMTRQPVYLSKSDSKGKSEGIKKLAVYQAPSFRKNEVPGVEAAAVTKK
jgi:hypothetical protein